MGGTKAAAGRGGGGLACSWRAWMGGPAEGCERKEDHDGRERRVEGTGDDVTNRIGS
jgi:hypothetical protein